ncbi:MAG: glycosyltransferase [Ilumatobacteraceae bacterium]
MPPNVSVLTAVHDPEREHLEACLASVAAQTIGDWEHIVVDDGSAAPYVREVLDAAAASDPRLTVIHRPTSGGIVAATTDALAAATGDLIALLDHDDVLEPEALELMAAAMRDGADLAYSDHDILTAAGHTTRPYYKPDFSPEQLRNQNYVLHLVVVRRCTLDAIGGFRPGFDGAQDHDMLLRVSEVSDRIVHVPAVLYHWRQAETSVASDPSLKPWAYDAGRRAVQDHCDRAGIRGSVEPGALPGTYRIHRELRMPPRVSIVIPTRGSGGRIWHVTRCFVTEAVRSLLDGSTYPELEIVVVYDTVTPTAVLTHLRMIAGDRLVLVEYTEPFNFSDKVNVGVAASSGELVLILNDDTQLIAGDSLEVMAAHLLDDSVGMVGPKLLFADGTVQDGGHVYNEHVLPSLVGLLGTGAGSGQLRPLVVEREVAGVTAAAAMVRRAVFDEVEGFDPILWMNFNDVDFSLKVRATGRRIVWTPYASWYHFESQTRPPTAEPEEFVEIDRRWHDEINRDPYYNPNFVQRRTDWLERPWHSGFPPLDDVDTSQSHRAWLWQRISETPWVSRFLVTQGQALALIAGLIAVTWIVAATDGIDVGSLRRLTNTAFPLGIWVVLTAVVRFRGRAALAAALAVAAAPSVIGTLASSSVTTVTWAAGLVTGVLVSPLRRRRPILASAVTGVAAVMVAATVWNARADDGGVLASSGGSWWRYLHDSAAISGDGGWFAVAAWWAAFLGVVAFVWMSGRKAGAAVIVAVLLALVVIDASISGGLRPAAAAASIAFVTTAVVAVAARIPHGAAGSERMMRWVSAAIGLSWLAVALEVVLA